MICCVSRNFVHTFGHQWPGALIWKTFKHFSYHSVLSIVGVKWSNSGSIYFQSLLDKLPPPHPHPVKLKVQKYRYLMRRISQAINASTHDVVTKTCLWQYNILTSQSGVKMTVQVNIDIAAKQRELVVVSASKNIKIFYHNIEIHFIALHCPLSALRFDQQPALTCTLTSLWLYLTLWGPAAPCSVLVSAPIGCGRGRGGSLAVAASHSAPRPRSLAPAASWAADRDSRTGDPVVRH